MLFISTGLLTFVHVQHCTSFDRLIILFLHFDFNPMTKLYLLFFHFNFLYLCLGKKILPHTEKVIDKKNYKKWLYSSFAQISWHPLVRNRNSLHPFCVTRFWTEQAAQLLPGWVRNKNSTLCRHRVNIENIIGVIISLCLLFWTKY